MISQTTDSTTYEHAGGTTTTTADTVLHSGDNFGVMTQHVTNDVIPTTSQPENIQHLLCEVCNVACTSGEILEKHKQGKKHLKNLQKQAISSVITPNMPPPPGTNAPLVEEMEDKKHKLYCDICDVACNNQFVFDTHLKGKKHSAKAIFKAANTNGLFNPMLACILAAQPSNGGSQKKPDTPQPAMCQLCNISCTSYELLNLHMVGKKHLKKLQESEKIPDLPLAPGPSTESTEGKIINSHEGKSTWCEICKIRCDTYDVLKIHMLGKKHQKNLEKSEKLIGPNPAPVTEPAAIGPLQSSLTEEGKTVISDGSKRKAKRAASDEDVETKKQKMLQGGAASDALRTCTVCNVVCNSPSVFISHLAGQKHAAMALKQAETGLTGQPT